MNIRHFTRTLATALLAASISALQLHAKEAPQPNIIFVMADDLGWGDVGFNGNKIIKTPHLDKMANSGLKLDRFYAASSICSPTRASTLTGRHPWRQGILAAHTSGLRTGEITIAEIAKEEGYTTGIFGKWHIGWVKPDEVSSRGHYSPPWHHGFDQAFVTTSAVPTWDPAITPKGWSKWGNTEGEVWKNYPYVENGVTIKDNMRGDDSRVIMDRAIPFIEKAAQSGTPFLTCIWFHTPHEPVVAGPEYRAMYSKYSDEAQHYYGCITAMDDQMGRLQKKLEALEISENTLIIFASDNGPSSGVTNKGIASAGPFRGSKHTIYEGGLRVPAFMYWPGKIKPQQSSDAMTGTVDIFPTVSKLIGHRKGKKSKNPLDGVSLTPLIEGKPFDSDRSLFFGYQRLYKGVKTMALTDGRYKILRLPTPEGESPFEKMPDFDASQVWENDSLYALYDLQEDPGETKDLKQQMPERFAQLLKQLQAADLECQLSRDGLDYTY
ncbi:sulfatase-like hydrolase/transferase [Pelagicoccus sp. SDUM812005]|uniref:sulfatase family protein n=1 Tax=Pelagicoccus sp. SDUM812005 TaxID=3041257 RepID=UPI00280FBD22|nr:sulfatase-like hydrolase/transferase [Pelagicoccus sp. SDUM812005]MDQ8183519.1 sulfatase-like hydrolase/transferase [Pelagicoccus sp. SDUM812005]